MKKSMRILSVGFLAAAFTGCLEQADNGVAAVDAAQTSPMAARSRAADTDLADRGVFLMSNGAAGNSILAYARGFDGGLAFLGEYPTGGMGTGAGLGNQGGVRLVDGYVFAVNNASNDISVLKVGRKGLKLTARIGSGGIMPVSIAVHDERVYVLNAGGNGNISGFRFHPWSGELTAMPNSTRALSGPAVGPAQIEFDPEGRVLVVTEKAAGMIDTYPVDFRGRVGRANPQPSVGATPFGFAFTPRGDLVVSDAFGGMPGSGAMTSYEVGRHRGISLLTGPVADGQTAPCWVAVTGDGRFAYTTNAGSGNVSSYSITRHGAISLLAGVAGNTGAGSSPIDIALSRESGYLYVNNSKTHGIGIFRVDSETGALTPVASGVVLPAGANGLAAR